MKCACVILSFVACNFLINFSTLSHKRHELWKKYIYIYIYMLLHMKCAFWIFLQILSVTFLILRRNERCMIHSVHCSSCTVAVFLSDFNETWIFLDRFSKKNILKYRISWNFAQWEPSCYMRTYRQTDRRMDWYDKSNSRFFFQFCGPAKYINNSRKSRQFLQLGGK